MVERWTRERRLEHTRSLLLDAAEEVFAEKGFTTATLDDISRAAGYTKGAIYKHFASDRGAEHAAFGHEFTLYLVRNPDARERVAAKRSEVVRALEKFIVAGIDRLGGTLLIPSSTFAHVLVATTDSVMLGSQLDDIDLFGPMLQMYTSAIKLP
ncbi:TetR family transcriptional regulator [Mycobacterium sp.]|uniref:TetR family transcriptional regulator n=1 Tax=Mycobacterium sp. TaxID=1785 RepID=UPI0025F11412|nr:TetR family transcriptional regulator [Mycobacterium sp.]MBW0015397.1 helix-turn-helix transcriptional regulator [Mycobacterium sp.]